MRLEIRDIESAMVYDIGTDGAVLGRERARTDISLRDESISKRHARIFMQEGQWLLEDLNSSNGTYVDDQRITAPIRLAQGRVFSLAQRRFEVVYVEPAGGMASNGAGAVSGFGPPPGALGAASPGVAPFDETGGQQMGSLGGVDSPGFAGGDSFAFEDDPESKGIGYFFVAVPKAVGFYLVQVPLMALNPIGRINRSFMEQPLAAMGNLEVAAYAIPAMFFTTLVGALFGFLAGAINGVFSFDGLVLALPTAGIAAAIGGVIGLISHPILKFLVELFRGESTPKSRTNYLLHMYVLMIVAAVPNGIGALLSAAPVPYIGLLGPLLLLLVSSVLLYFFFQWLKVFDVLKPIQYIVLGLGAVGVIFTAIGFVNGLIDAIDGVQPSGRVMAADTSPLTSKEKQALANNPEAARALAKAKAAQQQGASAAIQQVLQDAEQKQKEAEALAADQQDAAPAAPPPAAEQAPSEAAPMRANPGSKAAVSTLTGIPEAQYPLGVTEFVVFLRKRDAIERAVEADPSLVKLKEIRRDYERLWRVTYEVRDKYYRKRGPRWKKDKIYQRAKGQEIFERTKKYVDRVYRKLIQNNASKR